MEKKRNTRQRQAVIAAMGEAKEFRSAQKIHADMVAAGESIGLATVYRNLRSLAEEGAIDMLMAPDGEALYRACGVESHHHHIVCRNCLSTIEILGSELESTLHALVDKHRYSDVEHSLEIFGICPECKAKEGK
ncbi:MAG: Fur family transcriptional regulator [Actinomycetaceae bacterium]|nr:Fur family transcriptional regulator [Actinomycetaceae bacterium]